MHRPRVLRLLVAACCLSVGARVPGPALAETGLVGTGATPGPGPCELAGTIAEQANGLPQGLLLAIGRVESGRRDGARMAAWPWTINAAGKGQWFETADDALRAVRALMEGGTRSIDIGCFQINMLHHPQAFQTLEQGFDPMANAAYAARFLAGLQARTGSWDAAVAAYHSADPTRGYAYRQQVFAAWQPPALQGPLGQGGVNLADGIIARRPFDRPVRTAEAPLPRVIPLPPPRPVAGVRVWTPMPVGTAPGIVAMPPPFSTPVRATPVRAMTANPVMPDG